MRSRSVAIDNTPVIPSSVYYLWFCHEGTGTTLNQDSIADLSAVSTDVDIDLSGGTNTNIWDTPGSFTPAGDHEFHFLSGLFEALFGSLSTSDLGSSQFIFFVDWTASAAPTGGDEVFAMYGNSSGANYMAWKINSSGSFVCDTRDAANVAVSTGTGMGNVCTGARNSSLAFVDFENGTLEVYNNGVLEGSASLDTDNATGYSTRDFGIFGNITNDASTTWNNQLGSRSSGVTVNRLCLFRPIVATSSARVAKIAQELYETPHELPRSLHGL